LTFFVDYFVVWCKHSVMLLLLCPNCMYLQGVEILGCYFLVKYISGKVMTSSASEIDHYSR
jgi:hypothetical protein